MSGSSSDVLGENGVPIKRQRRPMPPPPGPQGSDTSSSDAVWPMADVPPSSDELAVAEPSPPATTKHWLKKKQDAEKHLQVKSAAYPYLWREVVAVAEATQALPLAVLKAAFLKLDDTKAAELNTLAKKQKLAELRLLANQQDIHCEVTTALIDLIN